MADDTRASIELAESIPEEESAGRESRYVGTIAVTIAALLCAIGVGVMPLFFAQISGIENWDIWTEFIGDLHPVLLSLPIGIFILVLVMEACGILSFGKWKPHTTFALFLGAVTAVISVICGNFLHLQGEYSDNAIANHLWGSTIFAVMAILTYLAKIWTRKSGTRSAIYGIFLTLSVGVLGFSAHAGGELTHGDPFGPVVQHLIGVEEGADQPAAPAKPAEERLVYKEVIVPILQSKCFECHAADPKINPSGKKRVKGKLDMTTIALMKKGGDTDSAVVAGDVDGSLMIERIRLPLDDEDEEHMPPPKKPQLEGHEIKILEWWISSNLPEGKTIKEAGAPTEIITAVSKVKSLDEIRKEQKAAKAAKAAKVEASTGERNAVKELMAKVSESFPNALSFVSQQDPGLVFTAVSMRSKFKNEDLAKLVPVSGALVELNLGATSVTDDGTIPIGAMTKLQRLWLNNTGISDSSLEVVGGLNELEYLNLYGTKVTDEGLKKLGALKKLKKLYLWQTGVTPAGAEEFKKSHPDCEINLGTELAEKPKEEQPKEEEKK